LRALIFILLSWFSNKRRRAADPLHAEHVLLARPARAAWAVQRLLAARW
jgi:hypothetical protein